MKIVSFRPGVIGNNTAFECMALIYKYLQKRHGYSFTIIKSNDDCYEEPAFEIIQIPTKLWRPIPRLPYFPPSLIRTRRIRQLTEQADGVLTVDPTVYPQGLLAIKAAHSLGKPVWFDSSVTLMGTGRNFAWKIARHAVTPELAKASGIIVTVPKCIERFQDLALFDGTIAQKFHVMGHPVDCAIFKPSGRTSAPDDTLRVLVVSRLVPEKGLYYILEALHPILAARDDVELQILGNGPMKSLLEREIVERGIKGKVRFLDPVPHRELPAIYGAADIFVNHAIGTSGWEEFFGAVNLEAMACGLPCVLSASGGITYAVREEGVAELVAERDVAGLRKAVDALLRDPVRRKEMGNKARRYVLGHYDIGVIGEKYRGMLEINNSL